MNVFLYWVNRCLLVSLPLIVDDRFVFMITYMNDDEQDDGENDLAGHLLLSGAVALLLAF